MHEETRQELEATLAARRELGPEHDEQLVAGFLDRIEKEIDRRVDERVAQRTPARKGGSVIHPGNLALCIPIIAIAGGIGHTAGLIVAFVALALVFLVSELRR
jgi:glyoxylase-like metal-dependent hydrolase (beta-lactamase superfamily II)